jgi:hypothetical protein
MSQAIGASLLILTGVAMMMLGFAWLTHPRTRLTCPDPASQVILANPRGPVCVSGTPAIRVPR